LTVSGLSTSNITAPMTVIHLHLSTTIIHTCQIFMLSPYLLDLPLCVFRRSFLNKTIFVSSVRANVWLSLPSFYCPNNIRWLAYVTILLIT